MGAVIKSDHYTQNDFKFYLKRKLKNLGLLSKKTYSTASLGVRGLAVNDDYMVQGYSFYSLGNYHDHFYGYSHIENELVELAEKNFTTILDQYTAMASFYNNEVIATAVTGAYSHVWSFSTNNWKEEIGSGTTGSGNDDWSLPEGIAYNHNGQCYVCDKGNHRVKILDMGKFDVKATMPSKPIFIATDELGNVYLAENSTTNKTIYKLKHDLTLITSWVVDAGASNNIWDIACANGKIYVTSQETNSIKSYNYDGTGAATVISSASAVVIATDGNYLLLANYESDIRVYTMAGALIRTITKAGAGFSRLQILNDVIYAQTGNDIYTFNIDGTNETKLVTGPANTACFCIDPKGLIYLSEVTNDTILKYNAAGVYVSTFGGTGTGDGQLDTPQRLSYNVFTGRIVVSDFNNTRLQNFKLGYKSKIEKTGGGAGTGDGEFTSPYSVAIEETTGIFYVADATRIQKFALDGTFILSWAKPTAVVGPICYSITEDKIYGAVGTYAMSWKTDGTEQKYFTFIGLTGTLTYMVARAGFIYIGTTDGIWKYEVTPDFEDEWIDITKYMKTDEIKISMLSEESDFSLGKISMADITYDIDNTNSIFDFETNPLSIFYSTDNKYQRNQSLIKIDCKGVEIMRTLIDGKNVKSKENRISIKTYSPLKYLETILSDSIYPALTDGMKISEILPIIINNRFFEYIIEYNAADIEILNDTVIQDVSELPEKTLDILKLLSLLGGIKFGLYNSYRFFTVDIVTLAATASEDYIITENNLLDVSNFNNGEHRFFKEVVLEYAAGSTASFVISEGAQVCFNEDRKVTISTNSITNSTTAQNAVNVFANFLIWPSKENTVRIPFLNTTSNLFHKLFVFNISNTSRGINFNMPSLPAGNLYIPAKNTIVDTKNRVIYYVMAVEHTIGSSCYTELKLKEFIGDTI